ncbi:sugar phosphate nucleotidyltransferase, partial [Leucobacter denitrificans]|uniref:sugar phosphate nucleotidyltransferase n=1 Tax=Leucobacter denitrificans TaxID=683042 RepID=UPI0036165EBD
MFTARVVVSTLPVSTTHEESSYVTEPVAVVLAGGKGQRLWPLSRKNRPKQFVSV